LVSVLNLQTVSRCRSVTRAASQAVALSRSKRIASRSRSGRSFSRVGR
jgi:hypothetical protein